MGELYGAFVFVVVCVALVICVLFYKIGYSTALDRAHKNGAGHWELIDAGSTDTKWTWTGTGTKQQPDEVK